MRFFKGFLLIFLLLSGVSKGFSQDSTKTAKVYFIRHTGYSGALIPFHCFVDTQLVCNLKNKRFSIHNIKPGTHSLEITTSGQTLKSTKAALVLKVEENKTYYIKMLNPPTYNFTNRVKIIEVSESMAKPLLSECEQETNCLK